MSSKTKNGTYKMLATQKVAVTRIARVITPEAIDNLKDETGGIFLKRKRAQRELIEQELWA
jgi:hypothetical protein